MAFISGNRYLNQSEMENNAREIWKYFRMKKCTKRAVAAMLGNMQSESSINPGIWEGLSVGTGGYGLVQWTPYTKYSEWVGSGWENNGVMQCARIIYESRNNLQWFRNPLADPIDPPISFSQFLKSNLNVPLLTYYWLFYYEHPTDPVGALSLRVERAMNWYNFLKPLPNELTKLPIIYYPYPHY